MTGLNYQGGRAKAPATKPNTSPHLRATYSYRLKALFQKGGTNLIAMESHRAATKLCYLANFTATSRARDKREIWRCKRGINFMYAGNNATKPCPCRPCTVHHKQSMAMPSHPVSSHKHSNAVPMHTLPFPMQERRNNNDPIRQSTISIIRPPSPLIAPV